MVPLSECPRGSKVRIVALCEDRSCRCRLCALGLTPGVEAEVREGGECCRLSVRGEDICLGAGLADRVMVSQV
jgi:ferrous iron transport protein A